LESYRSVIKNSKLFVNGGISPTEGAELIESGKVDGVFLGFQWITHPDLVKRVQHGKALDNAPDIAHLQLPGDNGDFSVGYTDYPTADY
jgi:2,4-dienoyl-CoA reductase-like NADH-dependent reductase (Old Yellow Enzyme family)